MCALLTPLHEEHQHLLPEIEALRETAEKVGTVDADELLASVAARLDFLRHHLGPHAAAEDEVLYPAVARLMGSPDATATMRRDHVEVHALTEQLERLHRAAAVASPNALPLAELRRVLYGLYAVVTLHFAKEEEVYVPILERGLTQLDADALLHEMHQAHHRLSAQAAHEL